METGYWRIENGKVANPYVGVLWEGLEWNEHAVYNIQYTVV